MSPGPTSKMSWTLSWTILRWALPLSAVMLAGCASSPTAMGGLPAGAPDRPSTAGAYPAVNDVPPPRETPVLTSEQQKKLEDELAAARSRPSNGVTAPAYSTGGARNP